jgi:hypothetical protein
MITTHNQISRRQQHYPKLREGGKNLKMERKKLFVKGFEGHVFRNTFLNPLFSQFF